MNQLLIKVVLMHEIHYCWQKLRQYEPQAYGMQFRIYEYISAVYLLVSLAVAFSPPLEERALPSPRVVVRKFSFMCG